MTLLLLSSGYLWQAICSSANVPLFLNLLEKMDTSGGRHKEEVAEHIYMSRMLKLQSKLSELGTFALVGTSFLPQQYIDVGWGDKDSETVALFGNTLPLSRALEKPNVIFELGGGSAKASVGSTATSSSGGGSSAGSTSSAVYCVVAFDADHESGSPYLLWLRVNIAGDDIQYASGRDIVRWQPPHPSEGSHPHRIFVFVLHQTDGLMDVTPAAIISKWSREGRRGFSLHDFMTKHNMQYIIGANAWRVEHDGAVVPKIVSELRDRVVLDSTGKRVLREEVGGEVVYEYIAKDKQHES